MPASNEAEETELFQSAYARARKVSVASGGARRLAPYDHILMRTEIPFQWGAYHEMLKEHATQLANELNKFAHHNAQLSAWGEVLPDYDQEDQMGLLMEFVEPIATSCVSHPHVLKARFIYSISHLSHQTHLITDPAWKEAALPADDKISYRTMISVATQWPDFADFKAVLDTLYDKHYIEQTRNFRNMHHHRYPPRFELGHTGLVTRIPSKDGRTSYGFGYVEPLSIKEIAPLLIEQHARAFKCFDLYSHLARHQLNAIYDVTGSG